MYNFVLKLKVGKIALSWCSFVHEIRMNGLSYQPECNLNSLVTRNWYYKLNENCVEC